MTTPRGPDWIESRRKELQAWRATLTKVEDEVIDRMIEVKGEQYVLSILGHLKNQLDIARDL